MTKQEIFDKVVDHLLTQGEQALGEGQTCMYLTSEGLKCAVGCLIPPEKYNPEWEGNAVNLSILTALGITPDFRLLLYALQDVHDTWEADYWVEELQSVASRFALTFPEKWLDKENPVT